MDYYPLFLLGVGVATIFILILWLRMNAFLGLTIAALLVGLLSPRVIFENVAGGSKLNLLNAISTVATDFGTMMGKIGITIALATIIGKALMDSGAADRIVRAFTRLFGESRASLALLFSGFVLSVPVFFDTVFFLLVPLAKALHARTRRNYLFYLMAIGAGGAITHSLVPPTPGPIAMGINLNVKLGMVIMMGILVGAPLAFVGFLYGKWIDRVSPVPMREVGDVTLEDLEKEAHRPDEELPTLFWSILPIVLPLILITTATITEAILQDPATRNATAAALDTGPRMEIGGISVSLISLLKFVGDPRIALFFSMLIALRVVVKQRQMNRQQTSDFTTSALTEAAMILLITSAGGAFGAMLKAVGVGDTLKTLGERGGISPLVLLWGVAVLFKVAQGSGTASMLITSGIAISILPATAQDPAGMANYLGYHPVYLVMAIGCGSLVGSWMNDSGFWVVAKLGGLTEREALKSWTMTLAIMGITGLPLIWVLTKVLPLT